MNDLYGVVQESAKDSPGNVQKFTACSATILCVKYTRNSNKKHDDSLKSHVHGQKKSKKAHFSKCQTIYSLNPHPADTSHSKKRKSQNYLQLQFDPGWILTLHPGGLLSAAE